MYLLRVLLLIGTFLTVARSHEYSDEFEFNIVEEDNEILDRGLEQTKIAGGGTTPIDEVKYLALIQKPANLTICNGFLISKSWVLTSAQCVFGLSAANLTVRLGSIKTDGTPMTVSNINVYSLFNNATLENDYAILQLSQPVNYSSTIQKINLPSASSNMPFIGFVKVFGWGVTTSNSTSFQDTLRGTKLGFINPAICQKLYGNTFNITETMFCAGTLLFGGKGACNGDIGGPAVYKDVAVGVVTLAPCGQPNKPTVFSRTATVVSWIKGVAGELV